MDFQDTVIPWCLHKTPVTRVLAAAGPLGPLCVSADAAGGIIMWLLVSRTGSSSGGVLQGDVERLASAHRRGHVLAAQKAPTQHVDGRAVRPREEAADRCGRQVRVRTGRRRSARSGTGCMKQSLRHKKTNLIKLQSLRRL